MTEDTEPDTYEDIDVRSFLKGSLDLFNVGGCQLTINPPDKKYSQPQR
jgi:hypothetical protein